MIYKLRFKLEYFQYYLRKYFLFFSIGLIIGSSAFIFKDRIIQLVNLPAFHPQIVGMSGLYNEKNIPESIKNLISFGLTLNTENDRPDTSPIVKSLEISPDSKSYTFTLNDNNYWHDSTKLTTNDINYQINGATFKSISPDKIQISLKSDFAPILSALSQPLFRPGLVGIGPYAVSNLNYQDGYIKSLSLRPKDPTKNPIIYRFYSNDTDLATAYKIGEVDQIETNTFPPDLIKWNNSRIDQKIQTNQRYVAVFFNTEKLNNKQLRQGLAYATPKTNDQNERCLGPISATSWSYNPLIKEYAFNIVRAKELFEKNKIDKITLNVIDRTLLDTAEKIKSSWENSLGIKTTIIVSSQIDTQNFDAILAFGGIPHDPDQYLFWHSTQTKTNLTKLNNSRIDKLLEEGRQTTNPQDRKRIYQDFQKYLLEESPAIFLTYPTTYTVTRVK